MSSIFCCCCPNENDGGGEYGDRNQLIRNGSTAAVSGNRSDGPYMPSSSNPNGAAGGRAARQNAEVNDEEEILKRIVDQTQANIIDVGALDQLGADQQEYMARSRRYDELLRHGHVQKDTRDRIRNAAIGSRCLVEELPSSSQVTEWLARPPPSVADPDAIRSLQALSRDVSTAIEEIKVEHKQDLVVHLSSP